MQLTEYFLYDYFGKRTIQLQDDFFTVKYESLNRRVSRDYPYADLKSVFLESEFGETGWSSLAAFIFVAGFVFLGILLGVQIIFGFEFCKNFYRYSFLLTNIFAGVVFCLQFIKYRHVSFYRDVDGEDHFMSLKLFAGSAAFIKEFKRRIEAANDRG